MASTVSNIRPAPDPIMVNIADYAAKYVPESKEAIDTARYCFMDTLGCALLALRFPECTKHLGPIVPGALLANGARVPGTDWQLEPVHAAFNIGAMIRWLDLTILGSPLNGVIRRIIWAASWLWRIICAEPNRNRSPSATFFTP